MGAPDDNTLRILLVDNDPDYVAVLVHSLNSFQGRQFSSVVAHSLQEATQLLESHLPDLILLDYYLPDGNGLQIVRKMSEAATSIPVILLTSSKDFRTAIEAMKHGVEEYLIKEEMIDTTLPRTIVGVLERYRIKKEIARAEREKLMSQKRTEAIRELIVTMCHEFNNPLAAVKISTDILARQEVSAHGKKLLAELNSSVELLEKQVIKLRDLNIQAQTDTGDPPDPAVEGE
jgi:response regulator of citrate/malate metabolism